MDTNTNCAPLPGVLVVEQVIPKGPADQVIEPGDVLVDIDGEFCTTFYPLAHLLDSKVGQDIQITLQRGGTVSSFPAMLVLILERLLFYALCMPWSE